MNLRVPSLLLDPVPFRMGWVGLGRSARKRKEQPPIAICKERICFAERRSLTNLKWMLLQKDSCWIAAVILKKRNENHVCTYFHQKQSDFGSEQWQNFLDLICHYEVRTTLHAFGISANLTLFWGCTQSYALVPFENEVPFLLNKIRFQYISIVEPQIRLSVQICSRVQPL